MSEESFESIEQMPKLQTRRVKTATEKARAKEKSEKSWNKEIFWTIVALIVALIGVYFRHRDKF